MEGNVEEVMRERASGGAELRRDDALISHERNPRDNGSAEARGGDVDPVKQEIAEEEDGEEEDSGDPIEEEDNNHAKPQTWRPANAGEGKCCVKVRRVAADPVELIFDPRRTRVSELKRLIAARTNTAVDEQRLVYAGRTLDSDRLLSEYGIKNGDSIHLVKAASNRAQEQASEQAGVPAAAAAPRVGRSEMLRQLSDTPLMRSLTSNPELMRSIMMANPQIREMVEQNPEIGHLISDPSFLRQSMEIARNPELLREVMRSNDRMMSNIEMVPGGFNHLRRMYETMQQPLESAGLPSNPSTDAANSEFARRLNVQDLQPGQLNESALPNPWQPLPPRTPQFGAPPASFSSSAGIGFPFAPVPMPAGALFGQTQQGIGQQHQGIPSPAQLIQLQQMPGAVQPAPAPDPRTFLEQVRSMMPGLAPFPPAEPPEVRFRTQLQSLEEMGFVSKDINLRALLATDGNVQAAVDYILRQG